MKVQFKLAILACCVLVGCAPPPVTRDMLVGNYVYKSEDPEGSPSDHAWDRLMLQADGKYDLMQGGPTKAKSETKGLWHFEDGNPPEVVLEHSGYPVRVARGEVRLLVDDDVGIWFSKTK